MIDIRFLLKQAEQIVPGLNFNEVAHRLRSQHQGSGGYEIVVSNGTSVELLAADLIPKLEAHLASKPNLDPADLFVWIWFEESAHLFYADDLLALLKSHLPGPLLIPDKPS